MIHAGPQIYTPALHSPVMSGPGERHVFGFLPSTVGLVIRSSTWTL